MKKKLNFSANPRPEGGQTNLTEIEKTLSSVEVRLGPDKAQTEVARRETWNIIKSRMPETGKVRTLRRTTGYVAASVAGLLIAAMVSFMLIGGKPEMKIVANDGNNPLEIVLQDNTRIWLHAGTEIMYPEKFSKKERVVKLTGEAFFNVTAVAGHPFRVETADVDVVVLGTKFNVMANVGSAATEVMLESGSVALEQADSHRQIIIRPGELAVVNRSDASITVSEADPYLHSIWKESELVFRSQPLEKIFAMLGKAYDVKIVLDNENLAKTVYTGRFKKSIEIGEVLSTIQMNTNMNVTFVERNNTFIIR